MLLMMAIQHMNPAVETVRDVLVMLIMVVILTVVILMVVILTVVILMVVILMVVILMVVILMVVIRLTVVIRLVLILPMVLTRQQKDTDFPLEDFPRMVVIIAGVAASRTMDIIRCHACLVCVCIV